MIRRLVSPAILAFLLTGCLPYSCNRIESRSLVAADSLSRAFAAELPVDTLVALPTPEMDLRYPRTVAFDSAGTLWATDARAHTLWWVEGDGAVGSRDLDSLRFPYLAGFRDGLPVVFSPELHRVASVGPEGVRWSNPTPGDLPPRVLQYAAVSDSAVWVKLVGEDYESRLVQVDRLGLEGARWNLDPPSWRWAGALRMRGQQVLSLSGYRPVVYRPVVGGDIDSTALFGFDSPMLARSRAFLVGRADQPPLLSPSGVPFGEGLLVLNVRPGWLRVEIYDASGELSRILVEPEPAFGKEFYPTDVAVFDSGEGARIAVAVTQPEPAVRMYEVPGR